MRSDPLPADAWFGALLEPVRGPVAAAWRRLPSTPEGLPRAGLGGAVVAHVARGWGTRRWQETGRVAITAMEALNQLVHRGLPPDAARGAWLTADLRLAIGVVRRAGRADEALLRRVACRFVDAPGFGAAPSSEAALFLRSAVAAGVVAGAVPDAIHAALDAWADALGGAIEATERDEHEERAVFIALAVSAIARLPDADARDRMRAVLAPGPSRSGALRTIPGWTPTALPPAAPRGPAWGAGAAVVSAMDAMLPGDGPLRAAGSWLLAGGGKRLRARIAQASARAVGADPEVATAAAAAVEWIHTASLVLDDIVDGADLRRGAPALHRASSPAFAAGVASWILVRVLLAPTGVHAALADAMIGLAEGQRAELARAGDEALTLAEWYAIAAAKTARLFSCAASIGGRVGGAGAADARALGRFGHEIGLAFQIVDDVLDLVGEEAALGKRPGQDLRSGRVTFPLLLLRDLEPGAWRADPDALLHAIQRHDIAARCLTQARVHRDRALGALAGLPGPVDELWALALLCVERRA